MNQYERIVSYIYQYNQGEKGANVGYAKIEKRGNQCRISVQIRANSLSGTPRAYLYRQFPEGIKTIYLGAMGFRGNTMIWKGSCEADKLFQTNHKIDDMEGIFIDGENSVCYATSWKNDIFFLGNWNNNSELPEKNSQSSEPELLQKKEVQLAEPQIASQSHAMEKAELEAQQNQEEVHETTIMDNIKNAGSDKIERISEEASKEISEEREVMQSREDDVNMTGESKDIQMQSICGVCPFKRKMYDYGKKILMSFPSMKPFGDSVARACVRMELQDIGCLPIAFWSLSGNRFLLHGYYCYRHLMFAQLTDGRYVLGVPGIFSEREQRNALKFGFTDFQSIGDFGKQQGAFGYWLLELPAGNE